MMKNSLSVPTRGRSRGRGRSRLFPAVLAVAALFVLPACEETRRDISKALGFEKPDFNEEEVLTGEPLAIPPDFDLRPPGSGDEFYYPSADSGAPGAVAPQPQTIPVQGAYPAQPAYGGYPPQPAYGGYPPQPAYGGYPPQGAYGQAAPQAIPPGGAQNVFAQATQAYGRANAGGYAATPSGAYNYGGYGGQQPYAQQPYAQTYGGYAQQPYVQQPGAQNVSGYYQGQSQAIPPVANPAAAPAGPVDSSQECTDVVVDVSGNYVCVE